MKRQDSILPSNLAINITSPDDQDKNGKKSTLNKDTAGEKIALPQQHEIRYVAIDEIMRCEADDNYTKFFLESGEKILISKSLKEYSDLLTPSGFLRTHQSHLINASYVKSWLKEDGGVLLMKNGDKIPVSKPNREAMKLALGSSSKSFV
ncbi:MAG: LytR/AlgR family response regulator transcription factor [Bacteroidia bacterium]